MAISAPDLFPVIFMEVQQLRMHWAMFLALYGANEERVALLRHTRPVTFGLIQECLRDCILLRLTQLAANPREGGHRQVSFDSLIVALPAGDPNTVTLQGALATFRQQTDAAEEWRDRRIAHFDHTTVDSPNALPPILRGELAAAMSTAVGILMLIETALHMPGFVHADPILCDVERLMNRLGG
jgi:hypothetical protein